MFSLIEEKCVELGRRAFRLTAGLRHMQDGCGLYTSTVLDIVHCLTTFRELALLTPVDDLLPHRKCPFPIVLLVTVVGIEPNSGVLG